MVKLLIADDEPLVCVGLRSLLNWEELGIEVAGTARNGRQAAELIENLRPEIVITDIKMPLMTGLELAEECAQRYGKIPVFIILTSFEEFEFVRRAIGFQAADYLIKLELSPQTLRAAIDKALAALNLLRQAESSSGGQTTQGLREAFFRRLYNGLFENREECLAQMAKLGIELPGPACAVLVGEITSERPSSAEKQRSRYAGSLDMLREMLGKKHTCYPAALDARRFAAVFCLDEGGPGLTELEDTLGKTIAMIYDYFTVRVRMALGKPVDDPLKLHESYLSARELFQKTAPEEPLLFFENRRNYKQQLVAKVQHYIRRNLGAYLSLREVAVVFNLSPNYLSQLFTKCTGKSFVEYITGERIAAAKEMLARGEGPVYEIADTLGFKSAFYFSKVFKKSAGVSPREFRQKTEE
jgi:two-component system response regulator YesN